MSPTFPTIADVVVLHSLHLQRYGGSAGTRDVGLLESAVMQARAGFGGQDLHEDLAAMAAAYLFSIVKNHPSVDGNKRTGLASALTFLDLNGIVIDHSSDILHDATMSVAEGRPEEADLATILRGLARSTA